MGVFVSVELGTVIAMSKEKKEWEKKKGKNSVGHY